MIAVKIAIISKNDKIRDFFRLEALNFGFSVDCVEKLSVHSDLSEYDLAIIDIDTIAQNPLNPAKRQITVSEISDATDINYPLQISELQKIYSSLFKNEPSQDGFCDVDESKIVFCANKPNLISLKGKKYMLSDAEYSVLKLLCENYPRAVSRERMNELFPNSNGNISDVYICKLRKKLEEPLSQRLILTIRSEGYKIALKSEWR